MSSRPRFYDPPEDVSGTVFDPHDEAFGPIMAAIQAGEFEMARARIAGLTSDRVPCLPEPATVDETAREPDTVVFTVSRRTGYTVSAAGTGAAYAEPCSDGGTLEEIGLYAEGEYVASYMRGDTVDPADADLIRDAANVAGVYLEDRDDGALAVPRD